ncbi:MAG: S-layer protein, partial [Akkermansiaceae bacterium]|nr:S-layer protein [Akkermansiaceae bacterium]
FKLSVFSYDPRSDYESVVKQGRGRRISRAAPESSLFLQKPTLQYPHEGGERFAVGSEEYRTIVRWIEEGMVYRLPDEPVLKKITAGDSRRLVRRGETGQIRVTAHFSDGSSREVTALADYSSLDSAFVEIDETGRFAVGASPGEGVLV